MSVEKDVAAHSTLRLRSFLRKFGGVVPQEYLDFLNGGISEPDWSNLYYDEWAGATTEVLNLALGDPTVSGILDKRVKEIRDRRGDRVVLIGGPPCQAYSIAARAGKPGGIGYDSDQGKRHLLYQEYISVLRSLRPAAFVMENVKGMLSATIDSRRVIDLVIADLMNSGGTPEYELFPLAASSDPRGSERPQNFVVYAERHGVPQARHRVIIVGIRRDLLNGLVGFVPPRLPETIPRVTVRDVLCRMPKMRSGISVRGGREDEADSWRDAVRAAAGRIMRLPCPLNDEARARYLEALKAIFDQSVEFSALRRDSIGGTRLPESCPVDFRTWIEDRRLDRLSQHETRGHMPSDLERYIFAACWATATGNSPKTYDFPEALVPRHANWKSGKFTDRYRVQLWDKPSSTVTCHISKDGHYFVHPDPVQCRSMTVREAARLQTFPDNYYFKGNRTQQYVQVGNAVPPFLARQIADVLYIVLEKIFSNGSRIRDVHIRDAVLA